MVLTLLALDQKLGPTGGDIFHCAPLPGQLPARGRCCAMPIAAARSMGSTCQAELPLAMARAGTFPRWFDKQSKAHAPALVFSSALMTGVVLLNYQSSAGEIFNFLLLIATACSLFMYLACMLAALQLRLNPELDGGMRARAWLPWIAGLGALYAAWTIYGAGGEAVAWGVALLLLALPLYPIIQAGARRATAE